jgi:hypothetical protein
VNANHIIGHGTTMVMTNLYWLMKSESPEWLCYTISMLCIHSESKHQEMVEAIWTFQGTTFLEAIKAALWTKNNSAGSQFVVNCFRKAQYVCRKQAS